jgi:quercetin dioxygenase-like cupin family protein
MNVSRSVSATNFIGAPIFSAAIKNLLHLIVLSGSFWLFSLSSETYAHNSPIKVEQLLQTTHSWDGTRYKSYLRGQPQITILKITVPRNTALDWHQHPMINAGYVLSGQIILEKKNTRERRAFHAGQALAECVNATHRGYTTDQPAVLIVFYAGAPGVPLSIKEK